MWVSSLGSCFPRLKNGVLAYEGANDGVIYEALRSSGAIDGTGESTKKALLSALERSGILNVHHGAFTYQGAMWHYYSKMFPKRA